MSKYTGPWQYAQFADGDNAIIDGNGDGRICEMATNMSDVQRDANARLIAAAPDLLNALEIANMALRCMSSAKAYKQPNPTRSIIEAAIAKAKGES